MAASAAAPAWASAPAPAPAPLPAVADADAHPALRLWQGLPRLLALVDAEGRLAATNPAWQQLLGLAAHELRGQPLVALAHADDRAEAQRGLSQVVDGGGPARFVGRWRCADGSHRRLQWTLAASDGMTCAIGEPAAADEPPLPATAVAVQAHRQTMRGLARLVGSLSHDLNNLLQVLRNTLELIQQRGDEPRQVAGWASSALRVVDRGAQMSGQLQSFAGNPQLAPQTVPVVGVLKALRPRIERLLGPHTTLQMVLPADAALATGDAPQLELAVLSLACNAVEAMPAGGQLSLHVGRLHVEEDPELATGDYITIEVGDTGAGMSEAVRERAFEPFFTTKALGRGSGLGLAQVYGFVQQIGGAARILPSRGSGVVLRLLLPAATAAAPPPQAADGLGPGPGPAQPLAWQPRVLVVVEDADRRQLLLSALNLLGYTRVQATDAATARLLIERQPPEMVVLGLAARPVGPDELARRARRMRPGVAVVRLDAVATAPDVPLDMEALSRAIDRAALATAP